MSEAPTRIEADAAIEGTFSSHGDTEVAGRIDGKIHSQGTVTVLASASCRASIRSQRAVVHGEIIGDVYCSESIELLGDARVVGNLRAPDVSVASSAKVEGSIDLLSPEPLASVSARQSAVIRGGGLPVPAIPQILQALDSRPIPLPPRPTGRVTVRSRSLK